MIHYHLQFWKLSCVNFEPVKLLKEKNKINKKTNQTNLPIIDSNVAIGE